MTLPFAAAARPIAVALGTSRAVPLAALIAVAGCASTRVDAVWVDPQLAGNPLRGARVLVVCEAFEAVVARICADQLAADLTARGATALTQPDLTSAGTAQSRDDARYLPAARSLGASAVWAATVGPDTLAAEQRPSSAVSIGIGGFGGFGRGSGGGIGVGVSVPIGGGSAPAAPYAADARVTDAGSGRLLWTARAGSPPSGDIRAQIDGLMQRLVAAAGDARLF